MKPFIALPSSRSKSNRIESTDGLNVAAANDSLEAKVRRYYRYSRGEEPNAKIQAEIFDRLKQMEEKPPPVLSPAPPERLGDEAVMAPVDLSWMSPREMADAAGAVRLAREKGIGSMRDALGWYASQRDLSVGMDLRTATKEFIICKHSERVSVASIRHLSQQLNRLAETFPDRPLGSITSEETTRYLMRWVNLSTRRSIWQILSTFFTWAQRMNLIMENPVRQGMRKPRPILPTRHVLTIEETRQLLAQAIQNQTIIFWALSLFAGIRTSEVARLDAHQNPWRLINLDSKTIDLREQPSKVWPRVVPIVPVLDEWLRWAKKRKFRVRAGDFGRRFKDDRRSVLQNHYPPEYFHSNPRWVPAAAVSNIGRRSYISCRLALPGASFAEVSSQVGNSEYNIRRYYYQKVSREHAEEYFTVGPDQI